MRERQKGTAATEYCIKYKQKQHTECDISIVK